MANLLGQNIGTNYKGILSLDSTINTPLDATLRAVTDGEGNASPLQLSTDAVSVGAISGARLAVKGTSITSATTALLLQNSAGVTLLKANDSRDLYLGSSTSNFIHQGTFFQGNYYAAGNWMFGTLSDLGARLGVKGSGTTSSTTALLVQNSAGTQLLKTLDNGETKIGNVVFLGSSTKSFILQSQYFNTFTNSFSVFETNAATGNAKFYQSISVGTSTDPVASAALDVVSTTKGFLPPRMTTTEKNAISTPAAGLIVYDETTNKLACYNGTTWNDLF